MFKKSIVLGVAVAISISMAGCSAATQAVTVGDAPAPTVTAPPVESGSQKVLTAAQIQQELPTAAQLGSAWGPAPASATDSSTPSATTYTPADCSFQAATGGSSSMTVVSPSASSAATGKVSYSLVADGAMPFHQTAVSITSYNDAVKSDGVTALADRIKKCATFTSTSGSSGVATTWQITPLSLPNYGDETIAYRLQAAAGIATIVMDTVQIVIGHNVVTVYQFGLGGITPDLTATVASAAVTNLNAATGTK